MSPPSATIDARTWRRDAPSVRRVASSLVRWATVIESVLKMMNEPTNSAIAAEGQQRVAQQRELAADVGRGVGSLLSRRMNLRGGGNDGADGRHETIDADAGRAATSISSSSLCLSKIRWATARSTAMNCVGPSVTAPAKRKIPATR